jgi:ubiquinone/menaquinone biosynthesis C-methylase UbiE
MAHEEDFNKISYQMHEKHFHQFADGEKNEKLSKTWFEEDTVDSWRHERMYNSILSLLKAYPDSNWLTVGDGRYGKDAHFFREKGIKVLATDISDVLLKEGKKAGYIDDYSKENAEALSFSNNQFDFVFCKESYHHFPRPMISLYEMLRVAKKGIILIEPNDCYISSTLLNVLFQNFKDLVKKLMKKSFIRHNFEESGNYIYGISKREIEKVALGMNYRYVAFKGIEDYYEKGVEYEKAVNGNKSFQRVKIGIYLLEFLTKIKLKQPGLLVAIIFKEEPHSILKNYLSKDGYEVIKLPENPYLRLTEE